MNLIKALFAAILFLFSSYAHAQEVDLLLKGGHVIDPKNGINEVMDVAIKDGKIVDVSQDISIGTAQRVLDVGGMYVSPGFIDLHHHAFWGTNGSGLMDGPSGINPDGFTFRNGVTTIVDPGSSGWRTFSTFKRQTIDRSRTRVLALLNIVGGGMSGLNEQNLLDMDPKMSALVARRNPEIVGFKVAHYRGNDWTPIERLVEAGELAGGLPVMVDFGTNDLSIEELFMNYLRPGDIFTHTYSYYAGRESVVEDGIVKPFIFDAREKGILFDVGFGGGSLSFNQLIPSLEQGFAPDAISTDLHTGSMNKGMKSMSNVMSMFLSLGMPVEEVILRTTWKPAKAIKKEDIGHLSPGVEADITLFKIREGEFGFTDAPGRKMVGDKRIEVEMTFRAGQLVWNLNETGALMWDEEPVEWEKTPPGQEGFRF